MKLSIIIVSWNTEKKLKKNIEAIKASRVDFDYEIFVVDNNSHDNTVEMIRRDFPQVKLIANKENLGFARANNQAIKKASGEYILLLNPDMLVKLDTLQNMIGWFGSKEKAWVAGCHLVDEKGRTIKHVRLFPTLYDQMMIVLKIPHFFPKVLNNYLWVDFDYNTESQVDSIRGGFFMIRKSKFDGLPLLDERYFLWFEEVDFCRMVREKGGRVYYTPVAKCIDYVGQSFIQVKRFKTQKYFRDSMLKYFLKWQGTFSFLVLYIAWMPILFFAYLVDLFKIKTKAKT